MKEWFAYIKRHQYAWLIVFLFVALAHGPMLLSNTIGIDTEVVVNGQEPGWLQIGRQGLVLLQFLCGISRFNPYYAGICTLLFLTLGCMLWSFLFMKAMGESAMEIGILPALCFSFIFLASGIQTLQLYFKLQSMGVSLSYCLMAVNLLFLFAYMENPHAKRGYFWILTVILNLVLFSVYQIFEVIFVFGTAAYLLLKCHFGTDKAEEAGRLWRMAIKSAGVFLVSVVLNQMISAIFFMEGAGYLTNQIFWGKQALAESFRQIARHIVLCLLGRRAYYSAALLFFYLMFLLVEFKMLRREGSASIKWLASLCLGIVCAAPFLMTVLMGSIPVARSQLVLPFSMAFSGFFLVCYFQKEAWLRKFVIVCCFLCVMTQFSYTQRVNYTDAVRYGEDVRMASAVEQRIQLMKCEEGMDGTFPLVVLGRKVAGLNELCVRGEELPRSFFDWDTDETPRYYFSSKRIAGFLNALGGDYAFASPSQVKDAVDYAKGMPVWPAEGCVDVYKNMIVVRLSEE